MIAVKTFDATGVAPNGKLFAADLNNIQAAAAGLTDLTQHLSVADVAIGESSLVLSRFGAGQAQLAGVLRVASGVLPGVFTTTQRDAIAVGKRPTGMVIFNSTTNQLEVNVGSDPTPNWQPSGSAVSGDIKLSARATPDTGWLATDGSVISRSTFASLFAAIGTAYGAGDGSTTFGLPDYRGRVPVGLGTHSDVNALGKTEGVALGARRPAHKHTINDPGHIHSAQARNAINSGAGSGSGNFVNDGVTGSSVTGVTVGPQTGNEPIDSAAFEVCNIFIKM